MVAELLGRGQSCLDSDEVEAGLLGGPHVVEAVSDVQDLMRLDSVEHRPFLGRPEDSPVGLVVLGVVRGLCVVDDLLRHAMEIHVVLEAETTGRRDDAEPLAGRMQLAKLWDGVGHEDLGIVLVTRGIASQRLFDVVGFVEQADEHREGLPPVRTNLVISEVLAVPRLGDVLVMCPLRHDGLDERVVVVEQHDEDFGVN